MRTEWIAVLLTALALVGNTWALDADVLTNATVLVLRAKQPVKVSGFGDIPEAKGAAGRVPVQAGAPAKETTVVTLSWDKKGLTTVFDCLDNGIVMEQKGRDNMKLWKDDCVYVWLDPGNSHKAENDIMVQVSAGGVVMDARNDDPKFDVPGLITDVTRNDKGYRVNIFIPWEGMGVPCPKPGDVWGLNLTRQDQPGIYDYETMEPSSWMLIPGGVLSDLTLWGHIIFAAADAKPDDKDIVAAQKALSKTP